MHSLNGSVISRESFFGNLCCCCVSEQGFNICHGLGDIPFAAPDRNCPPALKVVVPPVFCEDFARVKKRLWHSCTETALCSSCFHPGERSKKQSEFKEQENWAWLEKSRKTA